jgi:transcriptional regulator with XRE-family HTH domain
LVKTQGQVFILDRKGNWVIKKQTARQNQLSKLTGIPQATISAIENDRVRLGVERAKILARALKVHPGVLVFPDWELPNEAAA